MSTDTIKVSHDLSQFKTLKGNRQIKRAHVNRLRSAYSENTEAIQYNPILVNEKLEIIDGQHRFEALKELEAPVYYIEQPGLTIEDAQKLNSLVKTWGPNDYAHAYAENGNQHYLTFLKFREQYPKIGFNVLTRYLAGYGVTPTTEMFRNGTFKVGSVKKATENLDKLLECGVHYQDYRRKGFGEALLVALNTKGFDFEWFLNRLQQPKAKEILMPFDTKGEYLRAIEKLYNYNALEKNHIFFSTKVM